MNATRVMNALLQRLKIPMQLSVERPYWQGEALAAILERIVDRLEAVEHGAKRKASDDRIKLVIAGNHAEFQHWVRATGADPQRCRYVHEIHHAQGMRGAEVICVGTYWRNPLHDRVAEVMALVQE
jgi:hypothetical protein